ncbi:hypothetical protein AVEN_54571-1 [Araneus ventricosus]|uniref:Uncharacterized protein n=1 Tax=Araneus ventricosus TaxID=182803 RepID=A0A4Y2BLU7_ARAVE|nr:hypothetical protein AVEN_54571-1 [Araneus ventricosus]
MILLNGWPENWKMDWPLAPNGLEHSPRECPALKESSIPFLQSFLKEDNEHINRTKALLSFFLFFSLTLERKYAFYQARRVDEKQFYKPCSVLLSFNTTSSVNSGGN